MEVLKCARAGVPAGPAARRSAAVQAARSALASAGPPARGLDGENGVTHWAGRKPAPPRS